MLILPLFPNYQKTLTKTAAEIQAGNLVVFPSDTVYILAVDPGNQSAVDKLLAFKNRWPGKAISIAVLNSDMAQQYAHLNQDTLNLYQNLFPGPFTIFSPGKNLLARGIEAENQSLGIRIPNSPPILDLLKILKKPITATSANLSGRTPHYSFSAFLKTLSLKKQSLISLVVDAGTLPKNTPSTVIDALDSDLKILRPGQILLSPDHQLISNSETETSQIAKHLLNKIKNYSPLKPIVFLLSGDLGCGKTVFTRALAKNLGVTQKILSPTFVIYNCYPPSHSTFRSFYHFDLYRLKNDFEFKEIHFFEHFNCSSIYALEWPENMGQKNLNKLKKMATTIPVLFHYLGPTQRQISFTLPQP